MEYTDIDLILAYFSVHSGIIANMYKIVIYIINIQIVKHTMFDIWKKKKKKSTIQQSRNFL